MLYTTAKGEVFPAVVVLLNSAQDAVLTESGEVETPAKPESVNLQVFTNESLPNLLHASEVEPGEGREKYHVAAEPEPAPAPEEGE